MTHQIAKLDACIRSLFANPVTYNGILSPKLLWHPLLLHYIICSQICKRDLIHPSDFATLMWHNFLHSQAIELKFAVIVVK